MLKVRTFIVYVLMGKVKPPALCSVAVGVNTWCGIRAISKEMGCLQVISDVLRCALVVRGGHVCAKKGEERQGNHHPQA